MTDAKSILLEKGKTFEQLMPGMDFLELAKCKNCIYYKEGRCAERLDADKKTLPMKPDESCSFFTEKSEHEQNQDKEVLTELYHKINAVLGKYLDMPEENRIIVSLWIIGTWLHHEFETFPYLFLNAMRGSGKTRLLKIITALSDGGQMLASLKESTLFRTKGTLCIDEFEGVGKKDKNELRELLNAAYKKGVGVIRMRKVKKRNELGLNEENQEAELFEPYRPIAMANIWGMEEVLGDRCISILLEKSNNPIFVKLIEDFAKNPEFAQLRLLLSSKKCSLCSVVTKKYLQYDWNNYILTKYNQHITTPTTPYTLTTLTTLSTLNDKFFSRIDESGIDGRHLELLMPLFFISNEINEDVFLKVLQIATNITKERKDEELNESKDVMLFDYVTHQEEGQYLSITTLTSGFREFIGEGSSQEESWLNQKWMGKALKRLNLIKEKKRMNRGMEVILNIGKAREKLKIFRSPNTS